MNRTSSLLRASFQLAIATMVAMSLAPTIAHPLNLSMHGNAHHNVRVQDTYGSATGTASKISFHTEFDREVMEVEPAVFGLPLVGEKPYRRWPPCWWSPCCWPPCCWHCRSDEAPEEPIGSWFDHDELVRGDLDFDDVDIEQFDQYWLEQSLEDVPDTPLPDWLAQADSDVRHSRLYAEELVTGDLDFDDVDIEQFYQYWLEQSPEDVLDTPLPDWLAQADSDARHSRLYSNVLWIYCPE